MCFTVSLWLQDREWIVVHHCEHRYGLGVQGEITVAWTSAEKRKWREWGNSGYVLETEPVNVLDVGCLFVFTTGAV